MMHEAHRGANADESSSGIFPRPTLARVRTASSSLPDTTQALTEVLDALEADEAELTLVFFADTHDADAIASLLDRRTGARGVAGTSRGEISSRGFAQGTISGVSLSGLGVRAAVEIIPRLERLSLVPLVNLPETLARRIDRSGDELTSTRHLWLSLVDGMSGREALITPFFAHVSPQIGLVGGTLSDSDFSGGVRIIHHGRIYQDAAAIALVEYPRPFHTFQSSHLELSARWVTATRVSQDGMILEELDGRPAHEVYAELLGVDLAALDAALTGRHPLGTRFRGKASPIGLLYPCERGFRLGTPVHPGERLNLLRSGDLVGTTRDVIADAIERVGGQDEVGGMLLFHCVGRHIEASQLGQLDALSDAIAQAPVCGLNTHGEQYGALHVNHSVVGVVFG